MSVESRIEIDIESRFGIGTGTGMGVSFFSENLVGLRNSC